MRNLFVYIMFAMVLGAFSSQANAKDDFETFDYDLTREGVTGSRLNSSDYVVFMVYSYGKKTKLLTKDVCMRNAVHGILFKGLSRTESLGAVPAIMGSISYDSHKDYFDQFFKGAYMQFIEETNRGNQDVLKMQKGYRVGIKVRVNISALKRRLMDDKVLVDYKEMMM